MLKLSLILSLISFFLACHSPKPKIENGDPTGVSHNSTPFDQFVGTWYNKAFGNYEKWEKIDVGHYASMSFVVKGQDTLVNETVKVYQETGNWVYEVTAKGQNNGLPVKFTSNALTASNVNFSNPQHDFPTDINYRMEGGMLRAFIVGPGEGGGRDTIPFNYERVGGK